MYEHCHKQIFQNFHIQIIFRKFWAYNTQYSTAKNKSLPEQILCLLEERAGKDDDKVGGVPHLRLLHLGAEDHQLGGRVLHLQLSA